MFGFEAHNELGSVKLLGAPVRVPSELHSGLICAALGLQHYSEAQSQNVAVRTSSVCVMVMHVQAMETSAYCRLVIGAVLVLYSRFRATHKSLLLFGDSTGVIESERFVPQERPPFIPPTYPGGI